MAKNLGTEIAERIRTDKAKVQRALIMLADWDHAFVSPEGATEVATAFGIDAAKADSWCYTLRDSRNEPKGLRLDNGTEARGICAASLTCLICETLAVPYASKLGRGSQLFECIRALREHFDVGAFHKV